MRISLSWTRVPSRHLFPCTMLRRRWQPRQMCRRRRQGTFCDTTIGAVFLHAIAFFAGDSQHTFVTGPECLQGWTILTGSSLSVCLDLASEAVEAMIDASRQTTVTSATHRRPPLRRGRRHHDDSTLESRLASLPPRARGTYARVWRTLTRALKLQWLDAAEFNEAADGPHSVLMMMIVIENRNRESRQETEKRKKER